jgi:outer membrane cobalamin receptor
LKIYFSLLFLIANCYVLKAESQRLDDIEVIAYSNEDTEVDDSAITKSVIHLSRDKGSFETLADVLKQVNSLQIHSSGSYGAFTSVSLRGSSPNQVNVYLDGVALDAVNNSSMDLSQINTNLIEKIEIYRGNAPAYLGTNPIGGAINLITRKPNKKEKPQISLSGGVGSFNTWFSNLDLMLNKEKVSHFLQLDRLESEGDYEYTDKRRTPFDTSDDSRKTRQNNHYEKTNFYYKASRRLRNNRSLEFSQLINNIDQGMPGPGFAQSRSASYEQVQYLSRISATLRNDLNTGEKFKVDFHYKKAISKFRDPLSEIGLGAQDTKNTDRRIGLNFNYKHILDNHFITWTTRLNDDLYKPTDSFRAFLQPSSKRKSLYLGVEDQFYASDKLVLSPTLRVEHIQDDFASTRPGFLQQTEKDSETKFSWNLSGSYSINNNIILRSNISRNIRYPELAEIFGDRGGTIGNSSLVLEESTNVDIGLDWNVEHKINLIKQSKFSFNIYMNERKNLIQYVFDARGIGRAQNIAKGKIKGIEFEQHTDINKFLSFSQTISHIDSEITSSPFKTDIGKQVPGIYNLTYFAKGEVRYKKLKSALSLLIQEDMFYDKTNLLPSENKEIFNWSISYTFNQINKKTWLKRLPILTFEIKNLTDDQVEDFSGWPQPERTYLLSFKL